MSSRPKRVLEIVGGMVRAGVETWLMQALRLIDRQRVQMDFLVHTDKPCAYDGEIENRGSRLLRCAGPRLSPRYGRQVAQLLCAAGPYDAVHSHVHHFSGFLLRIARQAGVPIRIAHSHSDTSRQDRTAGWLRSRYLHWAKGQIQRHSTRLVAASRGAGAALYGDSWELDDRRMVLHCGIDLAPFRTAPTRVEARAALGIRNDEFIIGHTGRFARPKNHAFLLEVAAEIARIRPQTRLLLVGDGPVRPEIEARARELGIYHRILFAGSRPDVPALLKAMDVFVFPSLWEGLPLTLLEAQAAGLPCIVSDVISGEAEVVPGLIYRIPLPAGAAAWAAAAINAPAPAQGKEPLCALERSSFNIDRSLEQLYALYCA